MAKKKIYKLPVIIAYLMSLLGIYLLTAGLMSNWNFVEIIKSPIFWGLFLIILNWRFQFGAMIYQIFMNTLSKKK